VRELATRLRSSDVEIEVACLAPEGPVSFELQRAGVHVTALNAKGISDLGVFKRLAELIRERDYDTVFSFLIHANVAASIASQMVENVRFFQSIQTTQPRPRWHWKLQGIAAKSAEKIIVPSPSVAEAAQSWSWIREDQIVVIPNAIEPSEFEIRSRHKDNQIHIGFIGRLDPIKRVHLLVETMTRLERHYHLDIFGEGEERSRIEKAIFKQGVEKRVTLHGSIARPQDALEQIDLLVLPSQAEGFGLVVIEAMAAGVPVIVGENIPGIRDVIRPGVTAVTTKIDWPTGLAIAIWELMSDTPRRLEMIESAKRDVSERFTWEIVLPRYRKVLGID
jgi:glycosyltransferase involved in cell wall biosynthesis